MLIPLATGLFSGTVFAQAHRDLQALPFAVKGNVNGVAHFSAAYHLLKLGDGLHGAAVYLCDHVFR